MREEFLYLHPLAEVAGREGGGRRRMGGGGGKARVDGGGGGFCKGAAEGAHGGMRGQA